MQRTSNRRPYTDILQMKRKQRHTVDTRAKRKGNQPPLDTLYVDAILNQNGCITSDRLAGERKSIRFTEGFRALNW